jgi:LuxR family quorum sensing-dependent transcriptional regulator
MTELVDPFLGRRVLEFIDSAEAATLPQQITALFGNAVGEFGFHAYVMAGIPSSGISFDKVILANGWPDEWFDMYVRENLFASDTVPKHALNTVHPFAWNKLNELPCDPGHDKGARTVMERGHDFRLDSGICIPIRYETSVSAISLAGDRPDISEDVIRALHMTGLYFHARIQSLLRQKPQNKSLSDHEAEVLRWAAIGKTAWETSVIMKMPERKVRFLLTVAQQKLNAANRTAAVVQALVRGEIRI